MLISRVFCATLLAVILLPIPASATTLDVTYSGIIANGNDATGIITGTGLPGSLTGDFATITYAFDLSRMIVNNTPTSSSIFSIGPVSGAGPVQVNITILGGGGIGFSNSPNGSATDQAIAGASSQSVSLALPQFNEAFNLTSSVSNPAVPISVLQGYTLSNVDLAVAFSLAGPDFNAFGQIAHGDVNVQVVSPLPVPDSLPLFLTGLAAFGLFGWYQKRKAQQTA